MSQFSTMTTRERKMQAAAICREVQAQGDLEMDLGKKMSVPQDIMLEELAFTSNRGSRLFEKRKIRSEKYTFESIMNESSQQLNTQTISLTENGNATDGPSLGDNQEPSATPGESGEPNPDSIAPGYGGPLKDVPPEKFNSTSVPKSYHSPWEQAIISDPALAETLVTSMATPEPRADLPGFKSFNRVATPFGGYSGSPRPAPIMTLQVEPLPDYPDLLRESPTNRPSFNRSALGWVMAPGTAPLTTISPEPVLVPESEDL